MSAALDPPDVALTSWRRWERSGADARTDPVARRWLPLIGHNLRDAPVEPAVRACSSRPAVTRGPRTSGCWTPRARARVARGRRDPHDAAEGGGAGPPRLHRAGTPSIGDVDVLVGRSMSARRRHRRGVGLGGVARAPRARSPAHPRYRSAQAAARALDLHRYLLEECCRAGADDGVWQRAQPMPSVTATTVVPAAADLLLHVCVHGLRWSPVHAGHWVADAVRIIQAAGERLEWDVVVAEAARRRLGLQMTHALRFVRERGHVDVPMAMIDTLAQQPASWRDRLECRFKGRPVASAGGLFMIRTPGANARCPSRRAAAAIVDAVSGRGVWRRDPSALIRRLAARAWARAEPSSTSPPPGHRRGRAVRRQ